ncbi:MAG: TIGR02302 family protein, partial [Rhizobiaceae bacterium]|nr:TIGR02302 family protein [Rhizobiaceae bacterium]
DYGAASAQAEFALDEPVKPGARPLYEQPEMPLALPRRGGREIAAKASRDLTEHVWAGHPVRLQLKVTDDAGQEGVSEVKSFVLPERPFTNPLARALIEQRGMLALDANSKPAVLDLMDAITLRPEDTFDTMAHYLGIVSAETRLKMAETDDQLREVVAYLWEVALSIEDGDLSAAEKRLRQAQENLKQALENGASDEELDRLMKELREAMNDFLREFAERAQRNPNSAEQMPQENGRELRQSDLQKMLDQIEDLAKSGNKDKAQELLSQLQDMMNNLQAGRQQRQQQGQNGQQSEMRQQMDKLGDIMRRQQEMMNETFRLDQMQRGNQQRGRDRGQQRGDQGEMGEGEQGDQPGNGMTPEEYADALKQLQEGQGQLQGDLESLMKGLEGMGIQPGEGFGEAGDAMGEAEGALGDAQGDRAVGEQGRALEALRRGAQDMMQQMQQAMQGEEGGSEQGGRQQNADRDPLGRPRATTGPDFGDSVKVPDEIDVQRARQILEAIRKRLGNALSPEIERDYLERLLDLR